MQVNLLDFFAWYVDLSSDDLILFKFAGGPHQAPLKIWSWSQQIMFSSNFKNIFCIFLHILIIL